MDTHIELIKQEYLKRLRPINDLMFRLCAKDRDWCEELLRIVFNDDSLVVIENFVQYDLTNPNRRSVVLDALCRLKDGRIVNVEVQTGQEGDHQRRVRLHASLMTADASRPKMEFGKLPDICTVYICEFDIFGHNAPFYKVDRVLHGYGEILDNGYTEIYINALARDDSKLSRLMKIFVDRQSYDFKEFAKISEIKYYFLNTRKGTEEMDSVLEELLAKRDEQIIAESKAEGIREGKAEGIREGKAEGIREGKAEGLLEGTVSAFIGLVKEGVFTVADACRRAGISEEKFKAFMEKYDREHASVQLS